ncbi:glycosyltransferase family 2 protein [Jiella endophytica]|uniref:Glycosyltransferase family 2 protein n=1 Tax=Jiella endophytica TaxID=2558362 RepID=A0A4Y8RID6_9HYPH|nr:glycosyltransferase family 2 protein [Jiella endophytica]TFF21900.1 glycosyltransferase family 2 protein [Jiella endophytica]
MARTLIICPTHDHADALLMSIGSVRAQHDTDWRMVVICDGSPDRTTEILEHFAQQDPRITYVRHDKGERFGEAYRDPVIREASEAFVCHLSDDDIWTAGHLGNMTAMLEQADFAVQSPLLLDHSGAASWFVCNHGTRRKRHIPPSGLNNVAYRRDAYLRLEKGWMPAPPKAPSDVYMWNKFLARDDVSVACSARPSVLKLPSSAERRGFSATFRAAELAPWLARVNAPGVFEAVLKSASVMELVSRSLPVHKAQLAVSFKAAMRRCGMLIVDEKAPGNIAVDGAPMEIPMTRDQRAEAELAFLAVKAGAPEAQDSDRRAFADAAMDRPATARRISHAIGNVAQNMSRRVKEQLAALEAQA